MNGLLLADKRGALSKEQLIEDVLGLELSTLTERVFGLFGEGDGPHAARYDGRIEFPAYIQNLHGVCTVDDESLAWFTFDIFDMSSTGLVTRGDILRVLVAVHGRAVVQKPHFVKMLKRLGMDDEVATDPELVDHADRYAHGQGLSQAELTSFVKEHPSLMFPVFTMQKKVRCRLVLARPPCRGCHAAQRTPEPPAMHVGVAWLRS